MKEEAIINEIIPGILETQWSEIEKKISLLKSITQTVHVDLIDGEFAHNKTLLDPQPFKQYAEDFLFELHMMVNDPLKYVKPWSNAGFKRFIAHIEQLPDPTKFIADTQLLGEVGLAIDSQTSLAQFKQLDVNLLDLDCVLVMTVKAGFSGQQFLPAMLEKVRDLRSMSDSLPIEVDGGLNEQTIKSAWDAGANRFVATSSLFQTSDVKTQFEKLQKIIISNSVNPL